MGAGPGAHSHRGNERFYNVKLPRRYNEMLSRGELPVKERETLSDAERHMEKIMLGLRLREGIPAGWLGSGAEPVIADYICRGLLQRAGDRLCLTKPGRLWQTASSPTCWLPRKLKGHLIGHSEGR